MDFDIKRRSRICAKSERELEPGESYYSVLVETDDGDLERHEIAARSWDGPPESCISWWKSQIPERDPNRFFWAPDDVMIDSFEQFQTIEGKESEQYVLTLLLVQKRIFKLVEMTANEDGSESLHVYCARRQKHYQVRAITPEVESIAEIEDELIQLLFSDEPFVVDDSEAELESKTESEIVDSVPIENEAEFVGEDGESIEEQDDQ